MSFADYYKQEQVRLLFALDNALSQKAEDALLNEFAAVKKAQVQLQSKLGGRKGNIGINLIGALDETGSRAIGWQFRAYAGQQESKGINAGLFYRTISGGMLHGVNAFADYEDGDYGAFFRYGIGGEVRHSLVAFSANYYLPVTDERKVNSTVAAFSRKGYDAKLRLNAPDIERLRVAMDYYHFGGKRGTKKDSGFRYGVEVDILPALRLGVYHDTESEKFGGDISYSHTLNSNSPSFPQRRESITNFPPDLFAPVSREYSQRIATAAIDLDISLSITAMTTTATMTTPALTATRAASVLFTIRQDAVAGFVLATTSAKLLVTLPPVATARPWVLTLAERIDDRLLAANNGNPNIARIIASERFGFAVGDAYTPDAALAPHTITITEGSEDIISAAITLTTFTTLTAFATTTVTLGANAAINLDGGNAPMPQMPPPPNPPQTASADIPPSRPFAAKSGRQ